MRYSSVILARNEQQHIAEVIENVRPLSDEIIVVDDFSQDDTPQIAEDLGATVLQRALNDDWAAQRNAAMELVQSDWTLIADADERFDAVLSDSFANFTPRAIVRALQINRLNYYQDRPLLHVTYWPDRQIRGIRSDVRYDPGRPVHERPLVSPHQIQDLDGLMHHYSYADACELFEKYRRYGEIEKRSGQEVAENPSMLRIPVRIARRVLMENALKDGWPGIATVLGEAYGDFYAALQSSPED